MSERVEAIEAVVETPAGSRNKYRYDEKTRRFQLHKMLPVGAAFPFDFGFIPDTRAEDGDPLDVLILGADPTFPGCSIPIRLLGVLEAEQTEKGETIRNDRLVAIAETDKMHPRERKLGDLPGELLDQIEKFFVDYNEAEGRKFEIRERRGPKVARKLIEKSRRAARKRSRKGR